MRRFSSAVLGTGSHFGIIYLSSGLVLKIVNQISFLNIFNFHKGTIVICYTVSVNVPAKKRKKETTKGTFPNQDDCQVKNISNYLLTNLLTNYNKG